jgi:hypothetical protein
MYYPWTVCTTTRMLEPPRHPLVRYVGVLSSASRWREHVVPRSDDDKRRRQERPSEPQPPTVTKTTDVSSTLAGSSPTAEPEAQRAYRGSAAAAGSYVDWATLRRCFKSWVAICSPSFSSSSHKLAVTNDAIRGHSTGPYR